MIHEYKGCKKKSSLNFSRWLLKRKCLSFWPVGVQQLGMGQDTLSGDWHWQFSSRLWTAIITTTISTIHHTIYTTTISSFCPWGDPRTAPQLSRSLDTLTPDNSSGWAWTPSSGDWHWQFSSKLWTALLTIAETCISYCYYWLLYCITRYAAVSTVDIFVVVYTFDEINHEWTRD